MLGRTIAIGDTHGCAGALDALLVRIRVRPDDRIVTLGDYIDRGPNSKGVIDRLIRLADECRLIPLLGNHDEALLRVVSGSAPVSLWLGMGGGTTLDSYGAGRELSLIPPEHLEFLGRCLPYHETATHIFVHANYEPDRPMAQQEVGMLRWESLRDQNPGPHQSGKTAIAGHTSQKQGEILDLGYLKCIDTYCYGGGWLTALDVGTGEVWQVDRDGKRRR